MRKDILLFLLLLFTSASRTSGQNITFRHLTTDDGLSQFSVNSMYIDEQGIVWIGTREGLNRYNGNDIKTFKLKKNDPNSLFSNTVLCITGNRNGKVYLLCTGGIAEFDLTNQRFKTLLAEDASTLHYKDRLYMAQKNAVYIYDDATQHFSLHYRLKEEDVNLSCLHVDEKGNLWMGTTNRGVYKLHSDQTLSHPIERGNITSIYEDSSQELWIGSWEEGVYNIHPDGTLANHRHSTHGGNSLSSNFVRACCEDNAGNIWMGTFNGLNRYNKENGNFDFYTSTDDPESLSHPSIWCIVKDSQGTLWMGTYFGGVNYFNPEYEIYTRYKTGSTEKDGLSSPIVGRMTEDKEKNLWICTEGGGITVYNRQQGTYRWYRHQEGTNSLSHNNVKAIYYDADHERMWIGTHLGGLNKLDLRTGRFTHYRRKTGDPHSLPSDIIRDITPYKDKLIIATQNGVCLFEPESGHCEPMFKDTPEGRGITMVADLYIDQDSTLWIAATGEGVYSYDFETRKLTRYRHDPARPHSLSNNNVNNIAQDSQGSLWFSTSGSGLDRYRPETGDFENFDMHTDGLSTDCIYAVSESSIYKGQLLLITNQGFSRFDYPQRKFFNYGMENGFPLSAVNENALYVTQDGEVFLGGIQGMISFRESNLNFTPKPYHIFFSRLLVNGKEVTPGDDTGILEKSICHTPVLNLKANQSMFSIEYATSNFIPANRDEIFYRLEGFSDTWNHTYRRQMVITYTNLNPGTYTLVLKGGHERIPEVRLLIHILPPWYKTWWAYFLYTLFTVSLLWYIIRSYHARFKLRESLKYEQKHIEDIEALNQSKLRFFTNISHEFRTPLTLIVGQVESLLTAHSFTPGIYSKILAIYKSSLQLRELITELLDFRKQEQGHKKIKVSQHDLVSFLYENYLLFEEYARSRQIQFVFEKEVDHLEAWYDPREMQKVINNLISNSLKHTPTEGAITLKVSQSEENAVIEVRDTGRGIAAEEINKIFDRFYQTEQINSLNTGAGTGIGLALTKGIIELHHGTIRVESEPEKGSCFTVTLKLGNRHFSPEQIVSDAETVQQPGQALPPIPPLPQAETKSDPTPAEQRLPDATMLIVEDNDSIREMLATVFEPFYRILTAPDGEKGWELMQKEMPTIVLSDIVMPRMSGTELCKRIKSDFNTCHIPVVLLTARTAIEHTLEGLRIGADDYVTKPFNTHILITRCNNLVNSRRLLQEKFSRQPQAFAQMLATNLMDKEMLDRAMQIIEKHLDDTEFNVNTFAREMGMARTNLFTKLKGVTGQTPNDFILTIRLKKGAVMLRNNPELNITEIADRIGFSSSRYFSKCFKDVYHVSPLSYRKGKDVEEENALEA